MMKAAFVSMVLGIIFGAVSMVPRANSDDSEGSISSAPTVVSPGAPKTSTFKVDHALRLDGHDTRDALHIALAPLAQTPKSSPSSSGGGPLQIAIERDMPEQYGGNLSQRVKWIQLERGSVATRASVTSPGAKNLRVGVRVDLPPAAQIRFFGEGQTIYPVFTRKDISWKGFEPLTLWSPIVEGQTIGIEIVLPSGSSLSNFRFEIDAVLHGYLEDGGLGAMPKLCPGHVDAKCRTGRSGVDILFDAVAHIAFRRDSGGGFMCSGTMMNDGDERHIIPYFLTANHCISSQSEARSIEARWRYMSAACGSSQLDPNHSRTSFGADLLETSESQDSSLLVFRYRTGLPHVYSGWTNLRIPRHQEVFGLHHPRGTRMKYYGGIRSHFENADVCEDPDAGIGCRKVVNGIVVHGNDGLTEKGSSGSGLFMNHLGYPRLVGVLSGGELCSQVSFYGNFRNFLDQVSRYLNVTTAPIPAPPFDDHGNSAETATFMYVLSNISGSIERGGDNDWFWLHVAERGQLSVWTTGTTDTVGYLFDATSGTPIQIARDDDSGGFPNFLIARDVVSGNHYIQVRAYDSDTKGDYVLHVGFEAATVGPPDHVLPLVFPASDIAIGRFSYVRIVNQSFQDGEVIISALDDTGERFGPVYLPIAARRTAYFDSYDLEYGDSARGLSSGVGSGTGNWHLELRANIDIEAFAYVGIVGGPVTSAHEVATEYEDETVPECCLTSCHSSIPVATTRA